MPADPQRVKYARNALAAYRVIKNKGRTDEADARDLITDLMHLIRSDAESFGKSRARNEVQTAINNFEAEA